MEEDISWKELKLKLNLEENFYQITTSNEIAFDVKFKNGFLLNFIRKTIQWIYDEKGNKKDYKERDVEDKEDFILCGIAI